MPLIYKASILPGDCSDIVHGAMFRIALLTSPGARFIRQNPTLMDQWLQDKVSQCAGLMVHAQHDLSAVSQKHSCGAFHRTLISPVIISIGPARVRGVASPSSAPP